MHHSYVIPGIDAAVMREQAAKRLRDKRDPGETVVHYHALGQICNEHCEKFRFEDLKVDSDG